jgi:putative membrane protein
MNDTINKDLILRENLALQRTVLANQTTLLSFLRTSLYFMIAALSLTNLLKIENALIFEIILFTISLLIFVFGIINFFLHRKKINESKKHVGNCKDKYLNLNQ